MKYVAACLIKTDNNKVWLLLNQERDGGYCIAGWDTVGEALHHWENKYRAYHGRSYEASMSASLACVTTQPSIIWIPDDPQWIKENILTDDVHAFACRNVAIHFVGTETNPNAEKLWEEGSKPSLV